MNAMRKCRIIANLLDPIDFKPKPVRNISKMCRNKMAGLYTVKLIKRGF